MPRTIMLIRHGSTDMNSENFSVDRIRGWSDCPLNAAGRKEAEQIGDELRRKPPNVLVSSDLRRAFDTAQIVSQRTGVPISWVSKAFRPWNAGDFTGQKSSEAVPAMARYATERPDDPLPGNGESFNTFKHRFFCGLAEAFSKFPQGVVGVVSHHRNERLLEAWKANGFPSDGEIKPEVFTQKGEHPGASVTMKIPVSMLQQIALSGHRFGDGREESLGAIRGLLHGVR